MEEEIQAKIKPFFLPIMLIIFDANIVNMAIPMIIIEVGSVDNIFIGVNIAPIIPLKNIVIGAAVKLNI